MKKQNKLTGFLNSKGFYTALFTCLFGVLAIAAVVSIRNIDTLNKAANHGDELLIEEGGAEVTGELAPTGQQKDTPVEQLEKERQEAMQEGEAPAGEGEPAAADVPAQPTENALAKAKVNIKEINDDPNAQPAPQEQNSSTQPKAEASQPSTEDSNPPEAEPTDRETSLDAQGLQSGPETDSRTSAEAADVEEDLGQVAGFTPFAEGETMSWPLDGTVVMDYSADKMVYDKTLDQYRTNSNICISSDVGTQVKAAADGIVKTITTDPRSGQIVVIDHGNGWESKYAQLQDTVLVQEGQEVHAGQAIGGVGNPTKYGVLLGPHLEFSINKDSASQNPQLVLAK